MAEKNEQSSIESPEDSGTETGVYSTLGELADGAIVTEQGLATLFEKHPVSIKRAVERRELPPPTRLMGKPVWTVGAIRRFIEQRLEEAAQEQRRMEQRLRRHVD